MSSGSQGVFPRFAASALLPGNLLEMQILRLPLKPLNQKLGWDPEIYFSTSRLGDSVVCSSVRTTDSEVNPVDSGALPQILGDATLLAVCPRASPLCASVTSSVI